MRVVITSLLLCCSFATGAMSQDEWQEAEKKIVRLAPSAYLELPESIRQWLEARGCRIPQHYGDRNPHNVVRGRFTNAESRDWAVLCSRRGVSSIIVFAGESTPHELNPRPDAEYLQGIGNDAIGFSRIIEVADPARIQSYFEYHGTTPPPLSHDGVDDIFEPKASDVHYFARGRWHRWAGAD